MIFRTQISYNYIRLLLGKPDNDYVNSYDSCLVREWRQDGISVTAVSGTKTDRFLRGFKVSYDYSHYELHKRMRGGLDAQWAALTILGDQYITAKNGRYEIIEDRSDTIVNVDR